MGGCPIPRRPLPLLDDGLSRSTPSGRSKGQASPQCRPLTDDNSPGSDSPRGDQTIVNVRIAVNEALNNGAIVCPPHENRSISQIRKRTCEDQVPTAMGLPS
jgi:hypothetical protein